MYVDQNTMRELDFDYDIANLFAQGHFISREPTKLVAYASEALSYEMNDAALLLLENGDYAIIHAQSCSCWPDMGGADLYEGEDAFDLIASFRKNNDKYLGERLMSKYMRGK